MRRSPFLWSPGINTCWKRFDPFAKRRRRSATRLTGRSDLQSRTNCRNCCCTAKANRQRVAKALGLTERTLAQKLGEENTSYEKVVDRLRQSLALQYIKEPSVSVAQIAWLLGYEG